MRNMIGWPVKQLSLNELTLKQLPSKKATFRTAKNRKTEKG